MFGSQRPTSQPLRHSSGKVIRALLWLRERPLINRVLLIGYYLAVVLPHKQFGSFLNDQVFSDLSRDSYNRLILIVAGMGLLVLLLLFYRNTRSRPDKRKLWFYLVSTILLAVGVMRTLFVINIEFVHFPQYALFAVLVFPLAGRYQAALLWAVLAGMVDEGYQYFYLAPDDTTYYDFNDVITNLIGAAFGLIFLRSFGQKEFHRMSFWRSSAFRTSLLLLLICVMLVVSGYMSVQANSPAPIQLVRSLPESFWTTIPLGFTYHVLSPLEGSLLLLALLVFYHRIGT